MDRLQRAAAVTPEGPVLVAGGTGTGKTQALIGRVIAMLQGGVRPSTITFITFSGAQADHVRRRLEPAVGRGLPQIFIGTFEQYASFFLRRAGAKLLGITSYFTIWDRQNAVEAIADTIAEGDLDWELSYTEVRELLHWHVLRQASGQAEEAFPVYETYCDQLIASTVSS